MCTTTHPYADGDWNTLADVRLEEKEWINQLLVWDERKGGGLGQTLYLKTLEQLDQGGDCLLHIWT